MNKKRGKLERFVGDGIKWIDPYSPSTCYVLSTTLLCECRWLDGLVTWKNNLRNRWTCSHNAARHFPNDVSSVRAFFPFIQFNNGWKLQLDVCLCCNSFFFPVSCFIFFCLALINSLSAIFFRLNRITLTRRIGKWSIKFKYSERTKKNASVRSQIHIAFHDENFIIFYFSFSSFDSIRYCALCSTAVAAATLLVTMSKQNRRIFVAAVLIDPASAATATEQKEIAQRKSIVNGKNYANGYC